MVQGAGSPLALAASVRNLGLIPGELTLSLPPGTSFEMGNGLACLTGPGRQVTHLFSGNNVEDAMGRLRFVAFYLACGLAAALAQVTLNPASNVPMVGASGAISGVMGAYVRRENHPPRGGTPGMPGAGPGRLAFPVGDRQNQHGDPGVGHHLLSDRSEE
jgi:hypothetical protein